jgi:hypothetical protein
MNANRTYKDSVFSWLFSDPATLRELYGAITGIELPATVPIIINTLEEVLFKARINDISFIIGDKLVLLIEHQSTINENMPLRLLLYAARLYEKMTGEKDIYREKQIPLPRPEFIVLYNGTAPYPDEKVLKLSDSYKDLQELGFSKEDHIFLELTVKVYNINKGHNGPIVERCKTLEGYSTFISKVREHEEKLKNRNEAMKVAIKECIENGVLKDFLETNATEVLNMLLTEWNWDDAFAIQREEGRELGREEGWELGQNTVLELARQGYSVEQIEEKLAAAKASKLKTAENQDLSITE